jgi:anti-sigma B factor antagonist
VNYFGWSRSRQGFRTLVAFFELFGVILISRFIWRYIAMQFEKVVLPDGITHLILNGRLDLEGTQAIDQKFSFATTTHKENIIVDLSGVSFMSSIGIRLLVTAAKAQVNRGGKMVLAAPQPLVRKVVEMAGIDKLIPLAVDIEAAKACFA